MSQSLIHIRLSQEFWMMKNNFIQTEKSYNFLTYMKARKLFKNKNYKLGRFHFFPLLRKEDYNLSLSLSLTERE
jgi:hypothetical protein